MDFKKLSLLFFLIYLMAGLFIFRDYGIGWDDGTCRMIGVNNWNFILYKDQTLYHSPDKNYGPVMEMFIVGIERAFKLTDHREIYTMRHIICFLVFYLSVIAFFKSAKILFGNEKWALVSTLMLVLSPRIFGDSFFNSKDIAFLSFMIFAFYALLRLIGKPTLINLAICCLACALAIDIRVIGIILIPLSMVFLLRESVIHPEMRKKYLVFMGILPVLTAGFVYAFWPILWGHPFSGFMRAFLESKKFPWTGRVLYTGLRIYATQLPWHYLPVWILLTTPIPFILLWTYGTASLLKSFILKPLLFFKDNFAWFGVGFLCTGPIAAIIFLHSAVYNGWRHVFFTYPFFVLIAAYGFKNIVDGFSGIAKKAAVVSLAVYFGFLMVMIVYLHPFENVYFNFAAIALGKKPIYTQFETDYWGLSYKQGFEFLAKTNAGGTPLKVCYANEVGLYNRQILNSKEQAALSFKDTVAGADYYITNNNYMEHPNYVVNERGDTTINLKKKVYEIDRLGLPVLTVYGTDKSAQYPSNRYPCF